jgi:hypothetical protein
MAQTLERVPAEHRDSWRAHRVGGGEALASIGRRFGATPASIVSANKLASAEPMEGDLLLIPVVARPEAAPRSTSGSRTATRAAHSPVSRAAAGRRPATRPKAVANRAAVSGPAKGPSPAAMPMGKPAVIVARAESR